MTPEKWYIIVLLALCVVAVVACEYKIWRMKHQARLIRRVKGE